MRDLLRVSVRIGVIGALLFTSHPALAQQKDLKMAVYHLNSNRSFAGLNQGLKYIFNSKADHKAIDRTFAKYKKKEQLWNWRFEKKGDTMLLRVKGKVYGTFKAVKGDPKQFLVNGRPFHLRPKDGFEKTVLKMEKRLQQKSASGFNLLVPEAQALFGLGLMGWVAVAAVGGLGLWWFSRRANAAPSTPSHVASAGAGEVEANILQCVRSQNVDRLQAVSQDGIIARRLNDTANFKQGGPCPNNGMPGDFEDRIRFVAENFVINHRYQDVNDCIQHWQNSCQAQGWNMTQTMSRAHCTLAESTYRRCQGGGDPAMQPARGGVVDPTGVAQ